MSDLFLGQLAPDGLRCAQWQRREGVAPPAGVEDGYAWHALLAAVFGADAAPRPFRVQTRRGRPPILLFYSGKDAAALAEAAAFADPQAYAALGMDGLATRPMPALPPGRRLAFDLRVRPVQRSDRGGDRARTRERDVLIVAREAADDPGLPPERVYPDWVTAQLGRHGAAVERLTLRAVEGEDVQRRGPPGKDGRRPLRRIAGHSVVVDGILRIDDAEIFRTALARGIGRHRAFGYGMLLLRPPEA